jgi:hypothetical protein
MPFRSEAQHRLFRVLLAKGKISRGTFNKWMGETRAQAENPAHPIRELPERVKEASQQLTLAELVLLAIKIGVPVGAVTGVLEQSTDNEETRFRLALLIGGMVTGAVKGGLAAGIAGVVAGRAIPSPAVVGGAAIAAGVAGALVGKKPARQEPPPPAPSPEFLAMLARQQELLRRQAMLQRVQASMPGRQT